METKAQFSSPRKIGKHGLLLAGALLLGITQVQAQKRCDLVINKTPGDIADTACLSLPKLIKGGNPIVTVSNATRISNGGLKLCKDAFTVTSGGLADIAYAYDNSGSMNSVYAWISPTTPLDTLFFYDLNGAVFTGTGLKQCNMSPSDTIGHGTLTILDDVGTRILPLLNPLKRPDPEACTGLSGDPYRQRGVAFRAGMDFQAILSPTSTAGTMSFTDVVSNVQSPLIVNPANLVTLKAAVNAVSAGGTAYRGALDTAKRWLTTGITSNPAKAIIFLSDGRPSDSSAYQNLLPGMPPIYGIFMGSNKNYPALQQLSTVTGGLFYLIPPNRPDSLRSVIRTILERVTTTIPKSITFNNTTVGQISNATGITADVNGNVTFSLDSVIALKPGDNNFTVTIVQFNDKVDIYNFVIRVEGPVGTITTTNLVCVDAPVLVMINSRTNMVDSVFDITVPTNYNVRLIRPGSDLAAVNVEGITRDSLRVGWGDAETIVLPRGGTNAGSTTYLLPNYPFQGRQPTPVQNNNILQANSNSYVQLSWTHPRDAREFATYILPDRKSILITGIININRVDIGKKPGVTIGINIPNPGIITGGLVITTGTTPGTCCAFNCGGGSETFSKDSTGVTVFKVKTVSPFSFNARIYDNLGQVVNQIKGTLDSAKWLCGKTPGSDTVVSTIKILPVTMKGRQWGTGVYILKLSIQTLAFNRSGANEARVTSVKQQNYFNKFGYVRP